MRIGFNESTLNVLAAADGNVCENCCNIDYTVIFSGITLCGGGPSPLNDTFACFDCYGDGNYFTETGSFSTGQFIVSLILATNPTLNTDLMLFNNMDDREQQYYVLVDNGGAPTLIGVQISNSLDSDDCDPPTNADGYGGWASWHAGWYPPWDSGTSYEIGDRTSYDGHFYACNTAHTNHQPPNASYWDVDES